MEVLTKEIISMERNMDKVNIDGKMEISMMENGRITR